MKNIFATLITALGLISEVNAQVPTDKTLLWEVSGQGITKPSYLFGTIHLMCPDELKMPEIVKQKFNGSEQLFLEVDLDDPDMMKDMMLGMQMKEGATLEGLMGNDFIKTDSLFKSKTNMPLKMLNSAKPLLLMSLIYPSLLGCAPVSWEGEFQRMAKEKEMDIQGLEKLSDQIDVLEKIPYKTQSEMLVKMLQNLDSSKAAFTELINVYKTKDINKLHAMTTSDKDFGELEGALLNDRNNNWIPIIGNQAKKKPSFFAFGAGHLGGEKGVIHLLRKTGFSVKPVFYK